MYFTPFAIHSVKFQINSAFMRRVTTTSTRQRLTSLRGPLAPLPHQNVSLSPLVDGDDALHSVVFSKDYYLVEQFSSK